MVWLSLYVMPIDVDNFPPLINGESAFVEGRVPNVDGRNSYDTPENPPENPVLSGPDQSPISNAFPGFSPSNTGGSSWFQQLKDTGDSLSSPEVNNENPSSFGFPASNYDSPPGIPLASNDQALAGQIRPIPSDTFDEQFKFHLPGRTSDANSPDSTSDSFQSTADASMSLPIPSTVSTITPPPSSSVNGNGGISDYSDDTADIIKAEPCSWGESYWCYNRKQAEECGVRLNLCC